MIPAFSLKSLPEIHFGAGKFNELPDLLTRAGRPGKRILILLGGESFIRGGHWGTLQVSLTAKGISPLVEQVRGEPSPETVDALVGCYREREIGVVLAIGGGSVIDAGKAVSAMLAEGGPVRRFLEGVGDEKPNGRKLPFIAVPTTAGTGSESTSNAVLTKTGEQGFKRSLRHDNYTPDIAVIDPALTLSCPREVTVACGMDALSQLVEAYLSTQASTVTDALALDGLKAAVRSLRTVCDDGGNLAARTDMAYAALLSGIVLANAGLGVIHGFASAIGGLFPVPHGVVCGTLMAAGNRATLAGLRRSGENPVALAKYSRLGRLFAAKVSAPDAYFQDLFIAELARMTDDLGLPRLGRYGIQPGDLESLIGKTGNKYNPVVLSPVQLREILLDRL